MAFHEFKSHNNLDLCNTCSIIIEHVLHKSKPRDLFYGICKEQQICANDRTSSTSQ